MNQTPKPPLTCLCPLDCVPLYGLSSCARHRTLFWRFLRELSVGQRKCFYLESFSPSSGSHRGRSMGPQSCSRLSGTCMRCSKRQTWTQHAIFCANCGTNNVTGLRECRSLWCGSSYTSAPTPNFHNRGEKFGEENENDHDWMDSGWGVKKEEGNRFKFGRNGDDLLLSFECDYCVFGKLYATTTVGSNTALIRQGLWHSAGIGLEGGSLFPTRTPPIV